MILLRHIRKLGILPLVRIVLIAVTSYSLCCTSSFAAPIAITATIIDSCSIASGSSSTISFGSLNPNGAATEMRTGVVNVLCTNGSANTVSFTSLNGGMDGKLKNALTLNSLLTYHIALDKTSFSGLGFNNSVVVTVSATISSTDIQAAFGGNYNDSITVTVSY